MPEWSKLLDGGVAVTVSGVACWLVVWLVRYFSPVLKRRLEAQAELSETMKVTSVQQTDLISRMCAMQHDHGEKLANVVTDSKEMKRHIREIHRWALRECAPLGDDHDLVHDESAVPKDKRTA